ncbi:ADP-ribosylarginine hydrolase Tri1 [Anaerolineae bacterium]|nr:ADP-ribosylarginine hydrolase Tri1 [Anaerolineae bacterium]
MIGAIIGDVIGSLFENENTKTEDFLLFRRHSRFTDDTVLSVAIADAILHRKSHSITLIQSHLNRSLYAHKLKEYARRFPNAGYGQMFVEWVQSASLRGYRSYGNGSAMRVSAIGFAFDNLGEVLREARLSALVTHNHPEGIKGAQAIASAIFLARKGKSKSEIKLFIEQRFKYNLGRRLEDIRPTYQFDSACKKSVPEAIIAFLASQNFEDTIRKAISLGGDSDTIACMAGGIAQAFYREIPDSLVSQTNLRLDWGLKRVINRFNERYGLSF